MGRKKRKPKIIPSPVESSKGLAEPACMPSVFFIWLQEVTLDGEKQGPGPLQLKIIWKESLLPRPPFLLVASEVTSAPVQTAHHKPQGSLVIG